MSPALEEAIRRLQQMPPDRQDAFARLLLREIVADEQWMRSTAMNAEWQQRLAADNGNGKTTAQT